MDAETDAEIFKQPFIALFIHQSPAGDKTVARRSDDNLTHNDYYSASEIKPGVWIGEGLERLGLKEGENVGREQFVSLCDNTNPNTGKLLTQRRNEDGKRRVFFDFTCSAPKSVSIMAVTMNDTRIIEAHEAAAKIALKELERFAGARIRRDGADSDRTTGNLVGAAFTHNSSRALDPQLHTHFVLFNCTFDSKEKRWKALQTSAMFDAIKYGTEIYRNELANRLHGMGYEIEKSSNGFQIKGVSKAIQTRFSKRSQERDAMIARMEKELGRKVTNNEISVAIHKTRSRKMKGISNEEVRKRQLAQIGFLERMSLKSVLRSANGKPKEIETPVRHDEAVAYAQAHAFERNSVVPDYELLQAALAKGCGQMDLKQLKQELADDRNLVRVGNQYSSRQILETELYLIDAMENAKDKVRPINPDYVPSPKLGRDQAGAVRLILKSPDLFTGIRGLAGTGKSTALGELSSAIKTTGRYPIFCAPTAAATDALRKDGFEAVTLQKLLLDGSLQQRLTGRAVVILDEAGAVGIDDMKNLFVLAQQQGCRVVLSGDTGQVASQWLGHQP
ncbi:MAG: MobF family relaxase [Limisphaerales bacterium]